VLREFAAHRCAILLDILTRAQTEGQLPEHVDLSLLADQAYGPLWYRVLIAESGLSADVGRALARALFRQATAPPRPM
jgi:hypothetical protein